jgi:hypothetical protein
MDSRGIGFGSCDIHRITGMLKNTTRVCSRCPVEFPCHEHECSGCPSDSMFVIGPEISGSTSLVLGNHNINFRKKTNIEA